MHGYIGVLVYTGFFYVQTGHIPSSELVPWVEWEDGMAVGSRTPLAGAVKMAASLLQVRWVVLQELECSSLRGQVPLCSCLRFEAVLAELSSRRRQDLLVVFFLLLLFH